MVRHVLRRVPLRSDHAQGVQPRCAAGKASVAAGQGACTAEVPRKADLIIAPRREVADDARCELWSVLIGSIDPILSAVNWSTVN